MYRNTFVQDICQRLRGQQLPELNYYSNPGYFRCFFPELNPSVHLSCLEGVPRGLSPVLWWQVLGCATETSRIFWPA